jgi:hypothetical protein
MARKSKTKRSTAKTNLTLQTEPNTESAPANSNQGSVTLNYVEANLFTNQRVEDFEIWLSTLMGGTEWESQVDAFSDETC